MRLLARARLILTAFLAFSLPINTFAAECPRVSDQANPNRLTNEAMRTVVVTAANRNPVFADGRFSLANTLKSILATAFVPNTSSPIPVDVQKALATSRTEQMALLTTLIRTFRNLDRSIDNVKNNASARPHEAELEPEKLLGDMQPLGLFNRFDLAPANWSYCGEHRIVYGMGTGTNRLFLIFEAAVDNPDPNNARLGCQRIAEFWSKLQFKAESDLPDLLSGFYFDGNLGDGQPNVSPVLHHRHFGAPFGQVRGNLFLTGSEGPQFIPWMLREWRTFPTAQSTISFIPDTVKSNPNPELYNDDRIDLGGASGRDQEFADLRAGFQDKFLVSHIRELIDVDLKAAREGNKPSANDLFNQLSAAFDDKHNDFESISQAPNSVPPRWSDDTVRGSGRLKEEIENELQKYKLPTDWKVTPEHILARAEALSCGGCHKLTPGKPIASDLSATEPDVKWPSDLGFVHINEMALLSSALLDSFLPARCDNLQEFLNPTAPTLALQSIAGDVRIPTSMHTRRFIRALENAPNDETATAARSQLKTEIENARQQDSNTAGAFRRFRRTH